MRGCAVRAAAMRSRVIIRSRHRADHRLSTAC
jgi:hypothetical protein